MSSSASISAINRQIRSLVPGQTIRGEIISRNGSEVQIRVSNDMVLQARVDQNMNLELGKNMTFEVRNNGSALTLSPLFTNVSADVNVLKAIDMAGLPLNDTSVTMTAQMMRAGLSVDRNSLQQMYREVTSFPTAEISDVIDLHRLGLPVTEENISQMSAYRNLNHQILDGVGAVLEAMPEAMEGMLEEGNFQGLSGLYRELFDMIAQGAGAFEGENASGINVLADAVQEAALMEQTAESGMSEGVTLSEGTGMADMAGVLPGGLLGEALSADVSVLPEGAADPNGEPGAAAGAGMPAGENAAALGVAESVPGQETLSAASRMLLTKELIGLVDNLPLSQEEAEQVTQQLQRFVGGELGTDRFFELAGRLAEASVRAENGARELHRIFSGSEFRAFMENQLKALWSVRPEEVAQPGRMEELYRRMDRQLKELGQALEAGGQTESGAYHAVSNLSQNLDFMNQLNQMYTYIQLPLHLGQGEANGELYVYTNKRNLAAKDGKISALLHLDMEHLGPVDVYVAMEHSKVSTRFYVQDDEMLDFLEAHMDILTERLAQRGYDCSFSMTARKEGEEEENTGLGLLMGHEAGITLSQYAFDVRT